MKQKTDDRYKQIIIDLRLKAAIKKHGENMVRWAVNRWSKKSHARKLAEKRKAQLEAELREINKTI